MGVVWTFFSRLSFLSSFSLSGRRPDNNQPTNLTTAHFAIMLDFFEGGRGSFKKLPLVVEILNIAGERQDVVRLVVMLPVWTV